MSSLASTLESVTIYREGAVCLRRARVEPSPSRHVRLGGLPLSLEPGFLRARAEGGGLRVLDVRPELDAAFADDVDLPSEQKALEAAQDALARLETRRSRVEAELDELKNLAPRFIEPRRGDPPRAAPVASLLALTEFTESELARRLEERLRLDREIEDAREELELRNRRLLEASTARRGERTQLSRAALVTLSAAPARAFDLTLEYQVPGARWAPSYQLELERGMAGGTLRMRASVAQRSGEDWQGVALALSTASLSRRTDVPELKALKIGRRQEAPARSGWREPPAGLDELFEPYDEAMALARAAGLGGSLAPRERPGEGRADERSKKLRRKEARAASRAAQVSPAAPEPGPPCAPAAPEIVPPPEIEAVPATAAGPIERVPAAPRMRMAEGLTGEIMAKGAACEPPPALPERSLDATLMDYGRLVMMGVGDGYARGQLRAAPTRDLALVAGVSIQIELAMALVASARREAEAVSSLSLPARCDPVKAIDDFDYKYLCAAPADVPSTGRWSAVPVTACAVKLTPGHVCVPAVEPSVYRVLRIANPSDHALLPGPVDVTVGGEFLLTARLPAIPPRADASHPLGLGVEEAIKVARRTRFKEASGGILGGSTTLSHEIEIEIDNRLASPVSIEVRERVPWVDPEEKDVTVQEGEVRPPWERVDGPVDGAVVRGARRWRLTAPGGHRSKLEARFTIRIPSGRMVAGGNRRG